MHDVGTRASVPPSLVLYHPSAGRSDQRESHQRRPTGDVKTHCDISLCPAFKLGLHSPRIRLASLLARIPPINNRHALFSLPFRVVEHPSSSTDFAITIRIDEFASYAPCASEERSTEDLESGVPLYWFMPVFPNLFWNATTYDKLNFVSVILLFIGIVLVKWERCRG